MSAHLFLEVSRQVAHFQLVLRVALFVGGKRHPHCHRLVFRGPGACAGACRSCQGLPRCCRARGERRHGLALKRFRQQVDPRHGVAAQVFELVGSNHVADHGLAQGFERHEERVVKRKRWLWRRPWGWFLIGIAAAEFTATWRNSSRRRGVRSVSRRSCCRGLHLVDHYAPTGVRHRSSVTCYGSRVGFTVCLRLGSGLRVDWWARAVHM